MNKLEAYNLINEEIEKLLFKSGEIHSVEKVTELGMAMVEFKKLVELSIPRDTYSRVDSHGVVYTYCPCCDHLQERSYDETTNAHCPKCGQALQEY